MRTRWSPQIQGGTLVEITGARKHEWLAENIDPQRRDASPVRPELDPLLASDGGGAGSDANTQMNTDEIRTWAEIFPGGRCIVYEGDDPGRFVREIKEEFGFDPSQDYRWGKGSWMARIIVMCVTLSTARTSSIARLNIWTRYMSAGLWARSPWHSHNLGLARPGIISRCQ